MSHPLRKTLAALAVSAATTVALTGPAFAASGTAPASTGRSPSSTATTVPSDTPTSAPTTGSPASRLAAIKAKANVAINARLASLRFAISQVKANQVLTAADKQSLLNTLGADVTGLTALQTKIAGDTTVAAALADYQAIFTDYRVYALALPQVMFASSADDITGAALPALVDAQTRLAELLAGVDKGKDTPPVQAAMKDLAAQIQAIGSTTKGLSAEVLAFTPSQWDADHSILSAPRAALSTATVDVRTGRADIAFVVEQLKS